MNVSPVSVQSLFISMRFNGTVLATGTAFIVIGSSGPLLVTNWHNVSGRDPDTGKVLDDKTGGVPNEIVIRHLAGNAPITWIDKVEALYNENGEQLWVEHPLLGQRADLVVLPLRDVAGVTLLPYDLIDPPNGMELGPADSVSVVGFPFGLSRERPFAIWVTGSVASEPQDDFGNLSRILIDCRTRKGQSGSPVIQYRPKGPCSLKTGALTFLDNPLVSLVGVYSGRVNLESDLGFVWKTSLLRELVDSLGPYAGKLQMTVPMSQSTIGLMNAPA